MNLNRRGQFKINQDLIKERPELITRIMGLCIIANADCCYMTNSIIYNAYSNRFDEAEKGVLIPSYEWVDNEDGSIKAVKL